MLLRSFSFNKLNITEKELSLFKYLIEHPNYKCDVTYEILINALEGRIDYSKEFNLVGYETTIKRNHLMTDYARSKVEKSYDVEINDETENSLLEFIPDDKDRIEESINNELYNDALEFVLNSELYTINDKDKTVIDLKFCLLRSLQGIPDAIKCLKLACDNDSDLRDYIEVLLTCCEGKRLSEKLKEVV